MTIKNIFLLVFIIAFTASCASDSSKVYKLDKNNGFGDFVLGNTNYNNFIRKVRSHADDGEIIKREIFGFVIVPLTKIEKWNNKFIYGISMNSLNASSLNGQIYKYTLSNDDLVSFGRDILLDSLISNYGTPTSKIDTSYFMDLPAHKSIWKGKNVKLIYSTGEIFGTSLKIIDLHISNIFKRISKKINSYKNNPPNKLSNFESIGKLSLSSTKEKLIDKGILTANKLKASNNHTFTRYSLDYNEVLKQFFSLNSESILYHNNYKIIDNEIEFHTLAGFGNKDSSFTSLTIKFASIKNNNRTVYSDLLYMLEKKFGNYSFEEKIYTKNNTFRRAFWLSKNLIIKLTNKTYYGAALTFYNKTIPRSLLSYISYN